MRVIVQTWSQIQRTSSRLRYVNCGPGHIQWNDNTAYSGFNIQLNVSKLLLKTSRKFKERHTSNIVPHTTHIIQFTLCEPVVSTIYNVVTVLLYIFRLQYSTKRFCSDIGDISTIQWALYCKHGAKHSPHPPVYAMWTVVTRYTMQ
jgi:hypothetical protein